MTLSMILILDIYDVHSLIFMDRLLGYRVGVKHRAKRVVINGRGTYSRDVISCDVISCDVIGDSIQFVIFYPFNSALYF